MNNRNSTAIPAEVTSEVVNKLQEIDALLAPYCITLTKKERKEIVKMGNASIPFVQKSFEFAQTNGEFLPSHIKIDEWKIDLDDTISTEKINTVLGRVVEKTSDTRMGAGSEALKAALSYYQSVKRAATDGVAGAKPIYDELKKRYTRGKKDGGSSAEE